MPLQTPVGLTRPPSPLVLVTLCIMKAFTAHRMVFEAKRMAYHSSCIASQPHGMDELSIGVIFCFWSVRGRHRSLTNFFFLETFFTKVASGTLHRWLSVTSGKPSTSSFEVFSMYVNSPPMARPHFWAVVVGIIWFNISSLFCHRHAKIRALSFSMEDVGERL